MSDDDELIKHMTKLIATGLDRCDALTAERDAAYAQGYSDAETEISKSALGQRNYFLHSQYENATDHIKVLTTERDRLREALWAILACETPNANATVTRMANHARYALKGESHD